MYDGLPYLIAMTGGVALLGFALDVAWLIAAVAFVATTGVVLLARSRGKRREIL